MNDTKFPKKKRKRLLNSARIALVNKDNEIYRFMHYNYDQEQRELPELLKEKYTLETWLGAGAFGVARWGVNIKTKVEVVIKVIDMGLSKPEVIFREANIMKELKHCE